MKLFIVDNDPKAFLTFLTAITEMNWSYYSFSLKPDAPAGREELRRFLDEICQQRPDIVVLDAALTDKEEKRLDKLGLGGVEISEESVSGFQYCRALTNEHLGIPVVILTKYPDGQVARTAMHVGADRVLMKQGVTKDLIHEIEELVKSRTPHDAEFYWAIKNSLPGQLDPWRRDEIRIALDRFFLNDSSVRRFGLFTASLKGVLSPMFHGDTGAEKKLMLSLVKSQVLLSLVDPRLRDHVKHTGNVFWAGYRLLDEIQELHEPKSLPGCVSALYEPSDTISPREHLLHAWTLAALFHDYGYVDERGDQLAGLVTSLLPGVNIKRTSVRDEASWTSNIQTLRTFVDDLVGDKHFLYHFIDAVFGSFGSEMKRRDAKGAKAALVDHGFLSAHRLLDMVPLKKLETQNRNIVLHAALAIACHNQPSMLNKWEFTPKCYGKLAIGTFPVLSLLAFCDTIQTWDREHDADPALVRTQEYDGLLERLVLSDTAYVRGSEICDFSTSRNVATGVYDIRIRLRYFVEPAAGVKEICETLGDEIRSWIDSGRLKEVCEMTGLSSLLHGRIVYELPMLTGTREVSF